MSVASVPKTAIFKRPVDAGKSFVGVIDCPNCGQTHYTLNYKLGDRFVFCGKNVPDQSVRSDGFSAVNITAVL